jgi:hypothetical protein
VIFLKIRVWWYMPVIQLLELEVKGELDASNPAEFIRTPS